MKKLEVSGATVSLNDSHPEQYLWIRIGSSTFFLGVLVDGMTRGDVRQLALQWMRGRVNPPA